MRTRLDYIVDKDREYNFCTGKYENRIKSRGFNFHVSGAKTEQEHTKAIWAFQEHLQENGIHSDSWGGCGWEEAIKYGTDGQREFLYLTIHIDHVEEKENIKDLYKEWKKIYNRKSNFQD